MRDFEVEEAFPSMLIKQSVVAVTLNNDTYQRIVLVQYIKTRHTLLNEGREVLVRTCAVGVPVTSDPGPRFRRAEAVFYKQNEAMES